ncbi:MAG: Gx transporter family protein [Selenomonadaceae bacterium]|nr:Gx transporter family protein [Selenomonadaceae bacterium]
MINLRRLTTNALLISLSLILFFVEGFLPPLILPPGAKFGLANVVTLVALYLLSDFDALTILSTRIFLAGIFAGSPTVILFSLSGGLLSLAAMILLKRTKKFSIIGVSAAGGFFHNVGQILAAIIFMSSQKIFLYLPILGTCGIFVGVLIGLLAKEILRKIFFLTTCGK